MINRKGMYSMLALLLTALSVSLMAYKGRMDYIASLQRWQQYTDFPDPEDGKYVGYIFDDYNKRVNLDYVDQSPAEAVDNLNPTSGQSLSELEGEEVKEAVRAERSEKIIEERAGEGGLDIRNTLDSYDNMEDKMVLTDVMRKLSENELIHFKRLFDREVSQKDIKNILSRLRGKLSDMEYNWLLDTIK